MSIERLKTMKEAFMCAVESQMYNLAEVDAEELGEVVDMIKDLSEAVYYCEVAEAMEKAEKEGKNHQQEMMYYTPPMYYNSGSSMYSESPMYYNGGGRGGNSSQYSERNGNTDGRDMPRMYYNGSGSSGGGNSGGGSSGGSSGSSSQYSEREFPMAF